MMNKCSLFSRLFLFAMMLSAVVSCVKKLDPDKIAQGSWDPNFAVPLVKSNFTVYDILAKTDPDELIVIDPQSGLLALTYKGEAYSFDASDIIDLPSRTFSVSYAATADVNLPIGTSFSGSQQASFEEEFAYQPANGEELHEILLMGGNLNIQLETDLQHDVQVTLTFPYLTNNGIPFSLDMPLIYSGGAWTSATQNINLNNYLMDFSLNGTSFNEFAVQFQFNVQGTGNALVGNESISANLTLSQLEFNYITGYFGQQTVGLDGDSIFIRIFDNAQDGYFELTNPRLLLNITNSFGFPVEFDLIELKTINAQTGQQYPMTGFPNPITINHPSVMGNSTETELIFDKDNTTNITNVISPTPRYLNFEFEATSNPQGPPQSLNFITHDAALAVEADLELTLEGLAYGFNLIDTADFSFSEDVDEVEWVKLRVYTKNGFPLNVNTRLVMLNEFYMPIDSVLFDNPETILSGQIDANGRVISPTEKFSDIVFGKGRIDNLKNAKYLIVLVEAETKNATGGQIIRVYDDSFLEVRIGMQVQGSVNF
jgi:hypothetical protein